jgi:hypothetical protein
MPDCSGCSCACEGAYLCGTCQGRAPPAPPYTIQFVPPGEQQYVNNWQSSQSNVQYPFTTNANWPLEPNANHSQIVANNQAKSIFVALNKQSEQVQAGVRTLNGPIFKSYNDLIRYKQAQFAQAEYLPKKSVGSLFYPNNGALFPS